MIDKIKESEDSKKAFANKSDTYITLEHSYIDFQSLILNEKMSMIKNKHKKGNNTVFGKVYFSSLMVQNNKSNIEFYTQDMVKKFIDYQFKQTEIFFMTNLFIYLFLFLLPFLVFIFSESNNIRHYSLNVCYWT